MDSYVTYERKQTRHGLHLIGTILTGGLWLPGWLCCWAYNTWGPRKRTVVRAL